MKRNNNIACNKQVGIRFEGKRVKELTLLSLGANRDAVSDVTELAVTKVIVANCLLMAIRVSAALRFQG